MRFTPHADAEADADAAGMRCFFLTFADGTFKPLVTIPGYTRTTIKETVTTTERRKSKNLRPPEKIQELHEMQVRVKLRVKGELIEMTHNMRPLRRLAPGENHIQYYPIHLERDDDGGPILNWGVEDNGGPEYRWVKVTRQVADGKSNWGITGATHVEQTGDWIPKPDFAPCYRPTEIFFDRQITTEVCAPTPSRSILA